MIDIRLHGEEKELIKALELIEKLADENKLVIVQDCNKFYPDHGKGTSQRAYLTISLDK